MNHSQSEISQFNQMAAKAWDSEGPFKPLHDLNPLRMQFIEQHVSLYERDILDVGCGPGILSEALARAGATVTGIDLAADLLSAAQLHQYVSGVSVHYEKIAVEAFSDAHPETFDVITCLEMLEHVPDPISVIHAAAKACKPGGYLFFSTINRNPMAYAQAIVGAEYLLKIIPKGTHQYAKFIKPSELAGALRQAGLTVIDTTGISYSPITRTYSCTPSLSVNYLMAAKKS